MWRRGEATASVIHPDAVPCESGDRILDVLNDIAIRVLSGARGLPATIIGRKTAYEIRLNGMALREFAKYRRYRNVMQSMTYGRAECN